ncbi:glycosyltransferase [Methylocucumis oryzae]|uniref:glycosyltransferase n=1 Tax=Methylocucumis oryzae TaxID=1632867 RepID=UPI0006975988|nr:glycosyltransferase [Methylocucumis oryzae]
MVLIMSPFISVIMPVYNAERYVAKAVESILNQTFSDFEFIIINDGSKDKSLKILEKYAKKDNRIRLISRENRGLVKTLNEGLMLAKAPLIARMDADDISFLNRFELQAQFLLQQPEVVCVGGYTEIIDKNSRELTLLTMPLEDCNIQDLLLRGHVSISHPTVMYRKDAVFAIGRYRENFIAAEDLDLWLRLGEIGKLANLPHPLIKYRMLSSSVSSQNSGVQKKSAHMACVEAWQRRNVIYNFEFDVWRPNNEKKSKHKYYLKFGWWAF